MVTTFRSKRGKKRIVRYRADLPAQAIVSISKLDILIGGNDKGSQMVMPPSVLDHPDGETVNSQWLVYRFVRSRRGCSPD